MANRTARTTIDGMRTRALDPSMRTVGFGDEGLRKQATRIRRAQTEQAPKEQPTHSEKEQARLMANKDFLRPVSTLDIDLSSKELKPDYSLKKRDRAEGPSRHKKK